MIIKKIFFIMSISLLLFSISYKIFLSSKEEDLAPKVYIYGPSIVYDGDLSEDGIEQVKSLYSKNIENLILNSSGGEINLGMDLGEWVYDNKLNVIVRYNAFSSAANYVFPAGQKKFLYKNSAIGWHGGATQKPNTLSEKFFTKFILKDYIIKAQKREELFFKKINVDPKITTLGQLGIYDKYNDDYIGWTYSLERLNKLGVDNIVLIDEEWEPITEFKDSKLFLID